MARSRWRRAVLPALAALPLAVLAACGDAQSADDGRTQVEFFQFKTEAVATFDALIERFEEEHPDIDIVQNTVPGADAALRTRLVKSDVPPLMTINGNGATYGDLAQAGIFRDFSDDPALERINPASVEILNALGTYEEGETNGVPFAVNADGVIYNVDVFEELGLSVPETWDELLTTAEEVEAAGLVAFYHTWQEPWTLLAAFNPLAATLTPPDFWEERRAGDTTFAEGFAPAAEALLALKDHGPPDPFRFDYNTGNRAVAEGEAAMYLQGIWALPSIRSINPDVNLAVFATPATNDPEQNPLTSGVDVVITMPREGSPVEEEALTFVRWLTEPEQAQQYAEEQVHFSAVQGIEQTDPALAPLNGYFERGDLVGFPDHNVPSSVPLGNMLQGFAINEDVDAFLEDLDERYDAVLTRRGELGGD